MGLVVVLNDGSLVEQGDQLFLEVLKSFG